MAEVARYTDTDAVGLADGTSWIDAYISLNTWEAAEETDLVAAGDWHHVYCRASSGSADTTTVIFQGWGTDATHYIHVEAADGDEALKSGWDTSRYRLEVTGSSVRSGTIIFDGLQFEFSSWSTGLYIDTFGATGTVTIKNCRFNLLNSGTEGIVINKDTTDIIIYNNIIDGLSGTLDNGISIVNSNSVQIYNNVIRNRTNGITIDANTNGVIIKNNAIFNNTDDINDSDSSTIDYNASDDGDGTNPIAPSGADWNNEFVDPANGDFTLLNTGNLYQAGADDPSSGLYTTDMEGDAYNPGAYSIGVDEFIAAGGGVINPILSSDGISSLIFGGQILTGMLIMWNIMLTISVCYLFHRINKRIIYDPDLIQAQTEVEDFLNGG